MKKNIIILLFYLMLPCVTKAQDAVLLANADELKSKVVEVGLDSPATLYFYRPKKFAGGGPEIIVGTVEPDEVIVKIHNGQWYRTEYAHVGEREFVTGVFAINPEHYKYLIEPGKTYYIRCTLYSQGLKQMAQLQFMDVEEAMADMKELKEQKKSK